MGENMRVCVCVWERENRVWLTTDRFDSWEGVGVGGGGACCWGRPDFFLSLSVFVLDPFVMIMVVIRVIVEAVVGTGTGYGVDVNVDVGSCRCNIRCIDCICTHSMVVQVGIGEIHAVTGLRYGRGDNGVRRRYKGSRSETVATEQTQQKVGSGAQGTVMGI